MVQVILRFSESILPIMDIMFFLADLPDMSGQQTGSEYASPLTCLATPKDGRRGNLIIGDYADAVLTPNRYPAIGVSFQYRDGIPDLRVQIVLKLTD